jgi:carboxylate-amine ligase
VPEPRVWWWELRPHPLFGTIEVRVADAQTTVEEASALMAVVHSLTRWLAARHDAGESMLVAPTWRIEENRWSALRWGVEGSLADLETGARVETRERLGALLAVLTPTARELGCDLELGLAREMVEENGALRQRAIAEGGDLRALVDWLAARYV